MSHSTLPRGVDPDQVVHPRFYLRDIQTPFQRFKRACRQPRGPGSGVQGVGLAIPDQPGT